MSFFLISCSANKITFPSPPSEQALVGISKIYIQEFVGQSAQVFQDILTKEIYKLANFTLLEQYPQSSLEETGILSGEVLVYAHNDEDSFKTKKNFEFVEKYIWETLPESRVQIRKPIFQFVETSYRQPLVHRTLLLEIKIQIISAKTALVLYENVERIQFKNTYVGKDEIALLPISSIEMMRLGKIFATRLMQKINPSPQPISFTFETGIYALPWTAEIVQAAHPQLLKGMNYVHDGNYNMARKSWSYILYYPKQYGHEEKFIINNLVFEKLQALGLPKEMLEKLVQLRNFKFNVAEFEAQLIAILSPAGFQRYGNMIKSSARVNQTLDRINMAAAHYNLGIVSQLQGEFELASYHFAQANHWNSKSKYAQAWSDIQQIIASSLPLDANFHTTIEEAAMKNSPAKTLLQKQSSPTAKEIKEENTPFVPQPIELPSLENVPEQTLLPPQSREQELLDLR